MSAKRVCSTPGCPTLCDGGKCDEHRSLARRESDARRPNSAQRGYSGRWKRTRAAKLRLNATCELGLAGCTIEATEVHHLDGDGPRGIHGHSLGNLQSLCATCHAKTTAKAQPGGWNVTQAAA